LSPSIAVFREMCWLERCRQRAKLLYEMAGLEALEKRPCQKAEYSAKVMIQDA